MTKEIKQIIFSIDVKQDPEDAESKVHALLKSYPGALDILTDLGNQINTKEYDVQKKKKSLRAIIFSFSIFAAKNKTKFLKDPACAPALDLLFDLSIQGYQTAVKVLQDIGISNSDILRKKLLSLPVAEKHRHDKEIFLNEAIEEIKLSKFFSGSKGFTKNYYSLGSDERHQYELHKADNNTFLLRTRKIK